MTSSVKIWKFDISNNDLSHIKIEIKNNSTRNTALLDWNKDVYTLYEQIVYDISKFHLEKQGYNSKDIYVEFWCKSKFDTHALHVDCDEFKKTDGTYEYPLFTCLTYFNKNNCPTIITNIDQDKYIYKEFNDESELCIVYPQEKKQITFDGKYYHGSSIVDGIEDERYIIAINFWKNKPKNVNYYVSSEESITTSHNFDMSINEDENANFENISLENKCNLYKLFNDILYQKDKDVWKPFKEIIVEHENMKILFKWKSVESKIDIENLKKEMEFMYNQKEKINRFFQRHTLHSFYTKEVCNWIITETENYASMTGGWTTRRHDKYPTTDIPVERIPHVFNLVIASLGSLFNKMLKSYGVDTIGKIDVADLFIVKYDECGQKTLDMHNDGSFLTFNMALNSEGDYDGGGTLFEDGVIMRVGQGDVVWHCGQIKHGGLPITRGTRYLLVGFLNLVV